ncbi:MAG: sialidase family protein [Bacteroidales bacterium]|nr:sialidase family protein [Bacteroidales bacterium]
MKSLLIVFLMCLAGCDNLRQTQVLFAPGKEKNIACYRIPALVTSRDGDLIAVCDQRVPTCADLNGNRDINIVMRTSPDNGENWSEIRTIVDYPEGRSASDPSLITDLVTGTLFLFFNYMDHDQEKGVYYLRVTKSTDNGKTWSTPEDITDQITKPDWHGDFKFITSGRGMQTQSGKLVHTLVNLQKGLHLFRSEDHGRSWSLLEVPLIPGDESKIIELADGTWMVNSRVNGAGHRYVHLSADEGKTWVTHAEAGLADPGCNASLIREGKVLFFSNPNYPDQRRNLTLRISTDGGKTWGEGSTVHAGNSAYSSMTFIPGKGIGLLYERNNYSEIVFTRINQ